MKHLSRSLRLPVFAALLFAASAAASPGDAPTSVVAPGPPATAAAPAAAAPAADGRVLVIGFDGADWRKTDELMQAGQLPHLAALREAGTAGPLVSTNPAESAAGWAAINTGANPLKNGVASFFKRDFTSDGSPTPGLGHIKQETVEVGGMDKPGTVGIVDKLGGEKGHIVLGVGVFLIATLVLRLLLKAHALLSLVLGIALGAAAAYGTRQAEERIPMRVPGVVTNQVQLDGFWIEAARSGNKTVALEAPLTLGRPGVDGAKTLFGLGVPDVRASLNGDWFLYSTDSLRTGRVPKGDTKASNTGTGTIFRVDFAKPKEGGPSAIETELYGPIDLGKMTAAQKRYDELAALLEGDRSGMSFKESRALFTEKDELERTLAEMGSPPPGSRILPKEYKHRSSVPLRVVPVEGEEAWSVSIGDETQRLTPDAWSDFFSVHFEMGPLLKVHAVTRARVSSVEPFELYIDTLQIDPREPAFWQPVSEPVGFGAELAKKIGSPFETLGWGCMTNQVKDKLVDPVMFLQDVEFTMTYRRKLMQRMLEESDWRVLYSVFSTTDRVQHMMYRFYDPEHPKYDAKVAAQKMTFFGEEITIGDAIPAIYRQMDDIVGEVVAALKPEDTLILCADHGFTSYRRGMHVNNWLESEGYLVLKSDLESKSQGAGFQCVDWSRTRAYSLGLGMVFLNLEGREAEGIVSADESQALMEEISAKFLAARDEGRVVGSSATIIRDVYQGPEAWGSKDYPCADLMLGFAEFYRVSWSSTTGNMKLKVNDDGNIVGGDIYQDNSNPWSGDHASNDPNLVTGIFFCNRKVTSEDGTFSVLDIAPTVLGRLGASLPAHLDRGPLTFE